MSATQQAPATPKSHKLGGPEASKFTPTMTKAERQRFDVDTPQHLRIWQLVATLACLFFAVATSAGLLQDWQANRDAAADTRQVARAQKVQSALFRADALATNAFLVGGLEPANQRAAYDAAMDTVTGTIAQASAAQAADQNALAALNTRVMDYAQGIQEARANNRQGFPVGAQYLRQSSGLLRAEALPVVKAVVDANRKRAQAEMRSTDPLPYVFFALVSLVALVWVNKQLATAFHRRVNLGILGAAVAIVVLGAVVVFITWSQKSNHEQLRTGPFAQAVAAAQARTSANDARANEALRLIARGSGSAYEASWTAAAKATSDQTLKIDEGNTLREDWAAYTKAHAEIVNNDAEGLWDKAVALATAEDSAATTSFDSFDTTAKDLADKSFDRTATEATSGNLVLMFLAVLSALTGLAAAGMVAWGIGLRRKEFS